MFELLEAGKFDDALSRDEIECAERFAYLWFFRYVTRVPFLRSPDGAFRLETFRELAPGGYPVVEGICEAIVRGTPFIDLT